MCLLIHKPAGTTFTDEELKDFYKKNDDGFGFMYPKDGRLHIFKSLGAVEGFITAFRQRETEEMFIHLRMRTHGDVDIDNCHPYAVLSREEGGEIGPVWLMHNGVLSAGNSKDTSKSDTWHYINDVLRPLLVENPKLIANPAFQKLVAGDIGSSNKFALASARGDFVILNKSSGVEHKGAWFSNTYAWTPPFRQSYHYGSRGFEGHGYDYDYDYPAAASSSSTQGSAKGEAKDEAKGKSRGKSKTTTNRVSGVALDTVERLAVADRWEILVEILTNVARGPRYYELRASFTSFFFQCLREMEFDDAYDKLSVADIHAAVDNDPDGIVMLMKSIFDGVETDQKYILETAKDSGVAFSRATRTVSQEEDVQKQAHEAAEAAIRAAAAE